MTKRPLLMLSALVALAGCSASSPSSQNADKPSNSYSEVISDVSAGDTVLVVGTSVMQQFGDALKEALSPSGINVVNEARPMTYAFGEDTPVGSLKKDFQNQVAAAQPDLVLVQATFAVPVFDCSGTPEESSACRKEGAAATAAMLLPEMIEVLTSTGAKVAWVAFPATLYGLNPENAETSLATDAANAAVLERSNTQGDIAYSLASDIMGTDKQDIKLFVKVDGGYRQVRGPDGVHACQYGTQLVVERLADDIHPSWRTKATTWPEGDWRQGESYTMERYPWNRVVCSDDLVSEPIVYKAP